MIHFKETVCAWNFWESFENVIGDVSFLVRDVERTMVWIFEDILENDLSIVINLSLFSSSLRSLEVSLLSSRFFSDSVSPIYLSVVRSIEVLLLSLRFFSDNVSPICLSVVRRVEV